MPTATKPKTAVPPLTNSKYADMPFMTDIDVALTDQLLERGWVWQFAWNEPDGWHHTVARTGSDERRTATLAELRALADAPLLPSSNPIIGVDMVISIDAMVHGRWQPRTTIDDAKIDELAVSIQEQGLLNPPLVFVNGAGDYEVVGGHRRVMACRKIGLTTIPVRVLQGTAEQLHVATVIDNIQREDLSPAEEGAAFERLITELAISENELSKRLGKNRGYIQQRRAIAGAAPEVKAALASGTITTTHARAIALAAPKSHAIQRKALGTVTKRLTGGLRVDEETTRTLTEGFVQKATTKDLEALGWSMRVYPSSTVVWSAGDRPRHWTGAEMLEAVQTKRQPREAATDAGAPFTPAEMTRLDRWGYWADKFEPWVALAKRGEKSKYLTYTEARAFLADLYTAWEPMVERYAALGWTLTEGSHHGFEAKATAGAYRSLGWWTDVEEFLAKIESGAVATKNVPVPEYRQQCASCSKKVSKYEYWEDGYYCLPCLAQHKAEVAARKAAIRTAITEQLCCWIQDAPANALRMLLVNRGNSERLTGGRNVHGEEWARILRTADPDLLREALYDDLAYVVYRKRDEDYGFAPPQMEQVREVGA